MKLTALANVFKTGGFLAIHGLAIAGAIVFPPTWGLAALALGVYCVLAFSITAGYHRYFSHRSYKTSRVGQFALAWMSQTSCQKGVLWWTGHHRRHHRFSDQEGDPHSPKDGFWWSHVGWILSDKTKDTHEDEVKDLAKYPELRFLDRFYLLPPFTFGVILFLAGGVPALVWGLLIPVVAMWHATYTINSINHVWGWRVYETTDTSKNNPLLALLTFGEGWHNNHHYYPGSARQGFVWWEFDITFLVLKALSAVGLVWDLRAPPQRVYDARYAHVEPARALQLATEVARTAEAMLTQARDAAAAARKLADKAAIDRADAAVRAAEHAARAAADAVAAISVRQPVAA